MLIEHRPFYQCDFFLFHGVLGTPEWVDKFSPEFGKLDMMPSLVPHPNNYLGLGEQQLNFVTSQKDVVVIFENDRYVVQEHAVPNRKLPPVEDFINKVEEIVKIIYKIVEGKGSRLAFVTTGICKQMEAGNLDEVYRKLFNLPEEFSKNKVVEWNSRQVYRTNKMINEKNELLNVILDLNRIQITHHFEHKPMPYDGIEIGFDVNTYQGNSLQRFSAGDVKCFLNEAIRIEEAIETSLERIIEP